MSGGGVLRKALVRHIETCPNKNIPADEVVSYLRSTFKQYERTRVRELTRQVQSILQAKKLTDDGAASDSSSVYTSTTSDKKKVGKSGKDGEKLHQIEQEKSEPKFDLMKILMYADEDGDGDREAEVGEKRKRAMEDRKPVKLENGIRRNQKVDLVKSEAKKVKGGEIASEWPKYKDLGGMDDVLELLEKKVLMPLYQAGLQMEVGGPDRRPVTGILLHGPPGCGKTMLVHAIANQTGLPFYATSAAELVSGITGESEQNISELFSKARRTAPSIIFIDEIDALASKREDNNTGMENRIVTALLTCMYESRQLRRIPDGYVIVIAATNRPEALDSAFRRSGRFDLEIGLGFPDMSARVQILSVLFHNVKVEGNFDLQKLAVETEGFVGADLAALANDAVNVAMNRTILKAEFLRKNGDKNLPLEWLKQPLSPEELEKARLTMDDCKEALKTVQPSTKREGFSDIPDVKWDDLGGLHHLKEKLDSYITNYIKDPESYNGKYGEKPDTGVLLYGPPGCGKSSIAMAVANEAGANFILVKGPELLNKFVGESEKAVRTLFNRARTCTPCIIFFDEVDALTTKRGKGVTSVVHQLLVALDDAKRRKGVFVIGATNRPEAVDKAFLRPNRFGRKLYVPLPSAEERGLILKAHAREKPIEAGVDLMAIGKDLCENFSGADLYDLMNLAARAAQDDYKRLGRSTLIPIKYEHFVQALEEVYPSVSDEDIKHYNELCERFERRKKGCKRQKKF